jgi:hypothetical protein
MAARCAGAFQTYCDVAEFGKDLKVASGPTTKIEYRKTPFALDVLQHRCDVLADVVIASAFPEIFRMPVVMIQRQASDFFQVLQTQFHIRWAAPRPAWPVKSSDAVARLRISSRLVQSER